jgi:protein-L-isoaspartate(D-aspartate) O-methyltransferase
VYGNDKLLTNILSGVSMNSMQALVDAMILSDRLEDPQIIDAFRVVDRKYFVPDSFTEHIYVDAPLPIGNNQTISQPSTVALIY